MHNPLPQRISTDQLLRDLRQLIESTRRQVAQAVNTGLVILYWQIGQRIRRNILKEKRAEYGEQILPTLSAKLVPEYGEGFSRRNLSRMIRFAEIFPDLQTVSALSRQLGWSHFAEIIHLRKDLQRDFYAEMCRIERWSVRTLRTKISSMLFERTALSKKPAKLAKIELKKLRMEDKLSPDLVFRDPYFLDFLDLKGAYQEKDLEAAILRDLEHFLIEFGVDFAFLGRQKRITIGRKDYYMDLLFYHRGLRRMVVIELKLGAFQPEHMGQMELYLRWLEKHEMRPGEHSPLGLILCTGKEREEVELLKLDQRGIRVAEYLTELPPQKMLEKKLHEAICLARERLK